MIINSLSLLNFKNFEDTRLDLVSGINCFVGKNGVGKTNILDAIHYLSIGKSAINPIDTANIRYGNDAFYIRAALTRSGSHQDIACAVHAGKKKILKLNQEEYDRLSDHVGYLPVVMISPNDISLINDGNEARRKFFDSTISQLNKKYLFNLVRYQKALKQRNALLKHFSKTNTLDHAQLAPYDDEIKTLGEQLFKERSKFLKKFEKQFAILYKKLSNEHEDVQIVYESHWQDENVLDRYDSSLKRDLILQRTSIGVHRDVYHFNIDDKPIKRIGSQGQQKSLIVGLKIAQFEAFKKSTKITPALLLDDIFDKLDDDRMAILLNMVCDKNFGQIMLTDARPERTRHMLAENKLSARIFTVNDGTIEEIEDYQNE